MNLNKQQLLNILEMNSVRVDSSLKKYDLLKLMYENNISTEFNIKRDIKRNNNITTNHLTSHFIQNI